MRVVVTGVAGRVGRAVLADLKVAARYTLIAAEVFTNNSAACTNVMSACHCWPR